MASRVARLTGSEQGAVTGAAVPVIVEPDAVDHGAAARIGVSRTFPIPPRRGLVLASLRRFYFWTMVILGSPECHLSVGFIEKPSM